jgi:hypothetical protein
MCGGERERGWIGTEKDKGAGFFLEVGTTTTLNCHCGRATLDSSSSVAGFGPFAHGDSRLGIWMVAFF